MTQAELAADARLPGATPADADSSPDVQSLKAAAAATASSAAAGAQPGAEPSDAPGEEHDEAAFVALTDDGGLKKRVLKEGSGEPVPKGANVEVHYVGTLYPSGKKFDASRDRDAPFNFRLGQGQVIKGWDVGVQSMRVGELADLLCKPEYAYGASGSPPDIPANSTLKFEVEVLGFEEVAETPEQHWAAAKGKREEGNLAFRGGKFAAAKAAYTSASTHVSEAESAESVSEDERKALTAAVERNLAMCCLKLGENTAAAKWCDAVLELDPLNVKAYYLRGQAYLGMSEFERAVQVVEEGINATASDPASADLKTLLARIRGAKAEASEKEKSLYKRMFR